MNQTLDVAGRSARILIVDDEPHAGKSLEGMLAEEGLVLVTAGSGEQALAMVAENAPDLILLNITMPGMDRHEVTGRLKGNADTREIPVIMISSLDDRDARMLGLNPGAEDFLAKPVDRVELCVRVKNLLRNSGTGYGYRDRERRDGEATARTAELVERTRTLERKAVALTEQVALLDLAQDAIIVQDLHSRIVFWSHGAEVMYGWPASEAVGRRSCELLRTEFTEPVDQIEATLIDRGQWSGEVIHQRRDGTRAIVASRWALQRDAGGAPARLLNINSDITEARRVQAALEQSDARHRRLAESGIVGITVADLGGNILEANDAYLRMVGYSRDELLAGRVRWIDLTAPEYHEADRKAVEQLKACGVATAWEKELIRKDGSRVAVLIGAATIANGSLIAFVADVTERKRAEQALVVAKEAAEAANRAKSEFFDNISHELRTPMNGILGTTGLVLDSELTAEQREMLEMARGSAETLLTIINNMLDFSSIETGRLTLDVSPMHLRETVNAAVRSLAAVAAEKGVQLAAVVAPGIPEAVVGDPERLRQVLKIITGNAIKFTNRGAVAVAVEESSQTPDDVTVLFTVTDTGVGIPHEKRDLIFHAFMQADGSPTRQFGGAGLGLTVASELVHMMRGRVWVESEVGRGSIFRFTATLIAWSKAGSPMPGRDVPEAAAKPASGVIAAGRPVNSRPDVTDHPARVLIVDDERHNRQLLEVMLASEGFQLRSAASGEEALELVAQELPDLVLLDIMMPGMDGYQVADRLKSAVDTRNIPIIMITALENRDARILGLGAGAEEYLTKPVDRAELRVRVRNLLRLKAYGDYYGHYSEMLEGEVVARTIDLVERTKTLEQQTIALSRNEERTNYALGGARMGVWELDLATQRMTWSATMAPLFGLAPAQAPTTTKAFLALIHPDDRRMVGDSLERAGRDGTDYELEFRVLWPDGTTRWTAGRARMLRDADDEPVRLLGVGTDISDRKSLEAQLRQAQKMEAVGQLAGGVAHDFNNLLTAILGYSNLVIDTLGPKDPRRGDMDEVVKAGKQAAALTRQLLAFSRKQILQPIIVDVNALVADMRQMLARLIGEQVDLVVIPAPALATVRADPGQLEQVLMNLVVNARDAMPSGGRLSVETANVELDESSVLPGPVRPGPYVMLAVTDSGIGIDEATKQRLFEPFFTTKALGKGTGLGLATVYGIVKQGGGSIAVESEPGRGATFKVYLPCANEVSHVETRPAKDEAPMGGMETVLVVEDEEAVRFLMRVILEKAGYRVFDAANPEQTEVMFEQHLGLFDLLVTDVLMPGSSGPELFERLARRRADLKVLYVSAYTGDAIGRHGLLDPGVEFLPKPFTADALNRKVREVLDR